MPGLVPPCAGGHPCLSLYVLEDTWRAGTYARRRASRLSPAMANDKALAEDTLKVRDAKDVEQVVRAALASEQPLEIMGHGSKRSIGQPMATNALLDLSAL